MLVRSYQRVLITVCLVLPTLVACGVRSDAPETFPVAGVVTLNGAPVEGALVQFHPTSADFTPLAAGATGVGGQANTAADGRYEIEATFDQGKTTVRGLPAGAYKVTVLKMEAPAEASFSSPPKNVLDPRYASADTTPESITVTPDGTNTHDIAL